MKNAAQLKSLYKNNTRWIDTPVGLRPVSDLTAHIQIPNFVNHHGDRVTAGDFFLWSYSVAFPAACDLSDKPAQAIACCDIHENMVIKELLK